MNASLILLLVSIILISCGGSSKKESIALVPAKSPWPVEVVKDLESLPNRLGFGDTLIAEYGQRQWHSRDLVKKSQELELALKDYQNVDFSQEKNKAQALSLYLAEKRVFDISMQMILGSVRRGILLNLARENKMDMQDFIKSKVLGPSSVPDRKKVAQMIFDQGLDPEKLTPKQFDNFFQTEQMKLQQAQINHYLQKLELKTPIKVHFKPPSITIEDSGEWPIILGNLEARESIDFFGNFRCPSCAKNLNYLAGRMAKEQNFNIRFRFAATNKDQIRKMLVEAALCVKEQGLQKFFNFYYGFAEKTGPFVEDEMVDLARAEGVNIDQFNQCRFGGAFANIAKYHSDYSSYLGISTVPVFFVRGQMFRGPVDPKKVESVLPKTVKLSIFARIKAWFSKLF